MKVPLPAIGRFEVVGHLATGGMAEILLGRLRGPSGFERAVVIKRVLPHLAREERFVEMFLDEARIAARIRHPNVVQVHELARDGEELFIVMEYLEGESLSGLLRRMVLRGERIAPALACHVAAEACAGLHAAHELKDHEGNSLGLVHRDISPQNLFVSYEGAVKVLDFGIAVARDRMTKTETGQLKGKFEYMSPEQCLAKPLDRRADLFAIGVVLYELTLGRRLFKRQNQLLTLRAITQDAIPAPSQLDPGYPPELERIVLKALSRSRSERYPTAQELRRELIALSRALEPGLVGDDALKQSMERLFDDRIIEKREMLNRVRGGSQLTHLPAAEADPNVELPALQQAEIEAATQGTTALVTPSRGRPEGRSRALGWGALAAVALAGGAVGLSIAAQRPDVALLARGLSTVPGVTIVAPSTDSKAEPRLVTWTVTSSPIGATIVIGGQRRGVAPLDVELPRSDEPVRVEWSLHGYQSQTRDVAPRDTEVLDAKLERTRARPPVAAPKPQPGEGYVKW